MRKITYTNERGYSVTFGRTAPFFLSRISANSVGTTISKVKAIGQDGQTTQEITYNPRTVICEVSFVGIENGRYSDTEMLKNWRKITRAVVPKLRGVLEYKNDAGTYRIDCYPLELPDYTRDVGTHCTLTLQFIADYPFWRSSAEFSSRLGQVVGGKRYPVKYNPKMRYGTWVKNAVITNDTGVDTPFVVEVESVSDFVKLSNKATGEFLLVNQPIADGEKLVIDTGTYKVLLIKTDGSRELANYKLSLDSSFFQLPPGTSEIVLENGEESLSRATITYSKLFLGV